MPVTPGLKPFGQAEGLLLGPGDHMRSAHADRVKTRRAGVFLRGGAQMLDLVVPPIGSDLAPGHGGEDTEIEVAVSLSPWSLL